MLTYSPTQKNNTGLDPVNPALPVGEVQHQLAVYQFLSIPDMERRQVPSETQAWQRNRVELLKLRLLELNAEPLSSPPPALLPIIERSKTPAPAPARAKAPAPVEDTPAYDPWAELEKAVLAV